jgi:hypothetical protein
VDPIPEITNSSTDVTSHKRATPKTSLLSRETCRSLILFSLCNFMSIGIDAHTLDSVYTSCVKRKNYCVRRAEISFLRTIITKKIHKKVGAKTLQDYGAISDRPAKILLLCHRDIESG